MAHCPTPILMVSASTNRGELFKTYEALAAGAVDVLEKPSGDERRRRLGAALPRHGEAGRAHPRHHPPARAVGGTCAARRRIRCRERRICHGLRSNTISSPSAHRPAGRARSSRSCAACPRNFELPILLVLHINEPFGDGVRRLAGRADRPARGPSGRRRAGRRRRPAASSWRPATGISSCATAGCA